LANFVDSVIGFLNVLVIRLRSPLLAATLSFEIEMVFVKQAPNLDQTFFSGFSFYDMNI
jgi:hypothetical protein